MQPLAERLRPQTLDEYIGQKHLVGEGAVIRRMIEQKRVASFILWGLQGWERRPWRISSLRPWRCRSSR